MIQQEQLTNSRVIAVIGDYITKALKTRTNKKVYCNLEYSNATIYLTDKDGCKFSFVLKTRNNLRNIAKIIMEECPLDFKFDCNTTKIRIEIRDKK